MRKWYFLAGLIAFSVGLAGWATLGSAHPDETDDPMIVLPKGDPVGTGVTLPKTGQENEAKPLPLALPDGPAYGENDNPVVMPVKKPAPLPKVEKETSLTIPSIDSKPTEPEKTDVEIKTTTPMGTADTPKAITNNDMIAAPLSKQEPGVSLEWIGPPVSKVGLASDYVVLVKNTSTVPVQKVIVQVRVPQNVQIASTEPKAENIENVLLWEVGTLMSKQEKRLTMKIVTPTKGDVSCQAWVTFTGSAIMKMQVREPKLLVKASVNTEKVVVGDSAIFNLTVSNPGDCPVESVKITATLSEGVESARGNKLNYDLGALAPGETRTLQVPTVTKVGGDQKCEVFVEANDGLKAADAVALNVIQPRLDVDVQGPKIRYLDRKAVYTIKVTNPGDAPASNVAIADVVPAGFKFISADNGGQHDFATRSVKWFIGEIPAGQSKEVKVEMVAVNTGEHIQKVTAIASRAMKAEKEIATTVEGLSAISMELKDIDDPIEVGAETTYEIVVQNTGSKTETDLKLVCTIPPQMEIKDAHGPAKFAMVGSEAVFENLPKLAPRAEVVYKVIVKAKAKGDARFKAQLTTATLVDPVVKEESTRIYED